MKRRLPRPVEPPRLPRRRHQRLHRLLHLHRLRLRLLRLHPLRQSRRVPRPRRLRRQLQPSRPPLLLPRPRHRRQHQHHRLHLQRGSTEITAVGRGRRCVICRIAEPQPEYAGQHQRAGIRSGLPAAESGCNGWQGLHGPAGLRAYR